MSLFATFASSTKSMKPHFELALEYLLPVTFMITDGFLGWTLDSANKFDILRLAYYGISTFFMSMSRSSIGGLLRTELSDDEPFAVPDFPWIKLTRNDFDSHRRECEPKESPFLSLLLSNALPTLKAMVYLLTVSTNARMVVEEIKIGLRVETYDGSVRGYVKWEGLEKPAKELMEGDKGKEARKKVQEIREAAINAVKEGGSSLQAMNELILELTATRQV